MYPFCLPHQFAAAGPAVPIPWPARFLLLYLAAITVFGKGPTYLGYPPLFWGEIVLGVFALWMLCQQGLEGFALPEPRGLSAVLSLYVLLGAALTAVCIPRWGVDAVRDAMIWYYAAFYFFGLRLARDQALGDRVWNLLRVFWIGAMLWGVADLLFEAFSGQRLSRLSPVLPWRGTPVLANSNSELLQNMALGALLVLGTDFLRKSPLLRLVLSPVAVAALILFLRSPSRGSKIGLLFGVVAVLLLILARGGPPRLSSRVLLALGVAALLVTAVAFALEADLGEFTNLDRFSSDDGGTSGWRLMWWEALARDVLATNPAFGLGFGRDWRAYNPHITLDAFDQWPVRAPHNFNVTVFSRMGIVGAALWGLILIAGIGGLFVRLWRGRAGAWQYQPQRREELTFWLLMILATWGNATFGVLMEGPVLGVWFWFALGFGSGRSLTAGHPWPAAAGGILLMPVRPAFCATANKIAR